MREMTSIRFDLVGNFDSHRLHQLRFGITCISQLRSFSPEKSGRPPWLPPPPVCCWRTRGRYKSYTGFEQEK